MIVAGLFTAKHDGVRPLEAGLLIVMIAAGPIWYVSLGIIAHGLGRRWLAWTGLSLITSPIGPLVIYPLMCRHIRKGRVDAHIIAIPRRKATTADS